MVDDVVGKYIELKNQYKTIEEQLRALELFIFKEHRDDERIMIVAPRKTLTITEKAYGLLESIGVETDVVETRKRKLDEFDEETKAILLQNEKNFDIKLSKESVRLK